MAEAASLLLLAAMLSFALARPRGLPELLVAAPAALVVVAGGILSLHAAGAEAHDLAPTIGFLAAVLVLGHLCETEGLFAAPGAWMARGSRGAPARLLALVFGLRLRPSRQQRPAAAARVEPLEPARLPRGAPVLPPLGGLMALPWLAALAVEWLVFRRFFACDLAGRGETTPSPAQLPPGGNAEARSRGPRADARRLRGRLGRRRDPAWVAAAGAACLAVPALARRRTSPAQLVRAASPFLAFFLALGIVVRAADVHGLGGVVDSLATLLWRRVLRSRDLEPDLGRFLRLGALTVPPALVLATAALRLALRLVGA